MPGAPDNPFRTARKRVGLSQREIADALDVEQAAVSKWETGRALPETRKLVRIAALLKTSVEELVVGVDATYDRWRRDLIRHASGVQDTSSMRGALAKAEARIRELERENEAGQAQISRLQAALYAAFSELTDAEIDRLRKEGGAPAGRTPRGRRRP